VAVLTSPPPSRNVVPCWGDSWCHRHLRATVFTSCTSSVNFRHAHHLRATLRCTTIVHRALQLALCTTIARRIPSTVKGTPRTPLHDVSRHLNSAPGAPLQGAREANNHSPQGPPEKEDCHMRQPPREVHLHVITGCAPRDGSALYTLSSAVQPHSRSVKGICKSTLSQGIYKYTLRHWNLQPTESTIYNSLWKTSSFSTKKKSSKFFINCCSTRSSVVILAYCLITVHLTFLQGYFLPSNTAVNVNKHHARSIINCHLINK